MPKIKKGLSDKESTFVEEYLVDLNATQAAIRAGYRPKSAESRGYKLLHKGIVADAIARAMAKRSRRTGITQDRVLREIARVAFVNPRDVIDFDSGDVRAGAADDDLSAVASCKVKTMDMGDDGHSVEREVKLNDKIKALDMLCRHLGMYPDTKVGAAAAANGTGGRIDTGVVLLPEAQILPNCPPDGAAQEDGADEKEDASHGS